ncbi:unnamed protein product [Agarophyton chilense]
MDISSDDSDLVIEPQESQRAPCSQTGADGRWQGRISTEKRPKRNQDAVDERAKEIKATQLVHKSRRYTKAQREALKKDERKRKIQEAINKHDKSPRNCDDRLEVIVSKQMFEDRSKKDTLRQLRVVLRPEQISYDDRLMSNLISWRLKPIGSSSFSSPFVPFSLLVFTAEQYVDHMRKKTLDDFCQGLKTGLPGQKVMLVVSGIDNYCKRTERDAFKPGQGSDPIITKEAVQDSYVFLYMDYGIRTHDIHNHDELSHYICDISRAVAKLPHYEQQTYIESVLTYRTKKASRSTAPFVRIKSTFDSAGSQEFSEYENTTKQKDSEVSGHKLHSAYLQMLSLVPGISPDTARGIQAKYPTLQNLLQEIRNSRSDVNMFSNIKHVKSNKSIGRKVSGTIVQIFTSLDPNVNIN